MIKRRRFDGLPPGRVGTVKRPTDAAYPPRLLGEAEAARYLGVSPTTLRGLGIRRRRLGARRLYDRTDLDAFAAALPFDGENTADRCF